MRACDQRGNSESPCSPTIMACTLDVATPARSASSQRSRDESSTVPDAKICELGSPLKRCAATANTSQGFVTRM